MLQMQVIGVRIKGQFISNFKSGFYQIIWNPVKSLEVMLAVGQAWKMELAPIFPYKPCDTNQSGCGDFCLPACIQGEPNWHQG